MASLVEQLVAWDRAALEASQGLRWAPLTGLFVLASAWWVKSVLLIGIGGICDASRRRLLPVTAASAALSFGVVSLLVGVLKETVGRERPPLSYPEITALVTVPSDAGSFPSGHTAAAFAVAAAIAGSNPRLRWPLFGLAGLVGLSRIYLGVHFWLDVIAGAALGLAVGLLVVWTGTRIGTRLRTAPA